MLPSPTMTSFSKRVCRSTACRSTQQSKHSCANYGDTDRIPMCFPLNRVCDVLQRRAEEWS